MYVEREIRRKTVYTGKIVKVRSDVVEVHGGRQATREVVEHPGGVCVIPIDADRHFWCVRQFRYPLMEALLEFPAGKLEPCEDPALCAIRELEEETGLTAKTLIYLGPMYPSPGYLDEVLHLYLAQDLTQGEACPDEGEFLTVEKIPMDTMLKLVAESKIRDAKTIAGLFRAMQHLGLL